MDWSFWKWRSILQEKIKERDYEHYIIPIPFNHLIGKNKEKYLFLELEKRHPCFSDSFCFCEKMRITRKGFESDVFVMEKKTLSLYRKKNSFSIIGLKMENMKNGFVFPILNIEKIIAVFIFVLLIGINVKMLKSSKKSVVAEIQETENNYKKEEPEVIFPCVFFNQILAAVNENNGIISGLDWKLNGYKELISMKIENLYPEVFSTLADYNDFSSINFVDGNPSFNFNAEKKVYVISGAAKSDADLQRLFIDEMHQVLKKDKNLTLMEEKRNPFCVSFSGDLESGILREIQDVCIKHDVGITGIKINRKKNFEYCFEMIFDFYLQNSSGLCLDGIENYKNVFVKKENSGAKEIKNTDKPSVPDKVQDLREKIGTISYADGKKIVFYKQSSGKIIKQVE